MGDKYGRLMQENNTGDLCGRFPSKGWRRYWLTGIAHRLLLVGKLVRQPSATRKKGRIRRSQREERVA